VKKVEATGEMRSLAGVDERRGKDRARGWALRAACEGMEQA